jgi:uncharacterized oligopeptide transporter (OPT) family protein
VYLPFYLSFSAFLGLVAKWIYQFICKLRQKGLSAEQLAQRKRAQDETGVVVSSGLLGGESIAQVIIALITISFFIAG